MAPLRWGICATGMIGQDFANALKLNPASHVIAAVGARDPCKAHEFAARFGIKTVVDTCEALGSCEDVDIVYVSSLPHVHFAHVRHFLQSGKHVLCEKPLTLVPEETAELIRLARAANRFFMVGIWSRFFPVYVRLKRAILDGELGAVKLVQGNFCLHLPDSARLHEKSMGGGGMNDFGVYLSHLACWVFDAEKPESITAVGHLHPSGVDTCGTMTLKYSENRLASFTWNMDVGPACSALVLGEKGTAKIEEFLWCPTKLTLNGESLDFPTPAASKGEKFNYDESGGLLYEADHVKECLDKGLIESPVLPNSECQLIHDIMAEAHRQLGVDYRTG